MMTPRPPSASGVFLTICSSARRMTLKVPTRLICTTRLNSASGMGPFFVRALQATPMPAQLMTTLRPPKASTVRPIASRTLSSPVTSARQKMTLSPSSAASASPLCASRSKTAAFAPAPASSRTQASPRPDAPPVTTAMQSLTLTDALLSRRHAPVHLHTRRSAGFNGSWGGRWIERITGCARFPGRMHMTAASARCGGFPSV
ncbi:MAG: hypothetical protein A4E67_00211 [Syntrophaceae bacterium PtaB.Bin038]|nr:MAG: hypothetical protein A4E67_00211 [Syntrophaceae bacterium PtaB.Bin038]